MAAAPGPLTDDAASPLPFRQAVTALRGALIRPEVELEAIAPPRRLAPYAHALAATVVQGDEELADGRLVILHDPDGQDAWRGTFRLVTLVRADLEPEMAADPLLPEVCWSWLTGALDTRGVTYTEPSGTVTRAGSYYFGGMAEREPSTKIEIRASWTPYESAREPEYGPMDLAAHLTAWCELLCQCAGLPPVSGELPELGVVPLPQRRRGPQSR